MLGSQKGARTGATAWAPRGKPDAVPRMDAVSRPLMDVDHKPHPSPDPRPENRKQHRVTSGAKLEDIPTNTQVFKENNLQGKASNLLMENQWSREGIQKKTQEQL